MQLEQTLDYMHQIEELAKRAKCKKAFYLYDDAGNKQLVGVFSPKKASEIRNVLRKKNMLNRLTEFDVKTTEPDTIFNFS
jgi:hypothetical protein